MVEMSTYERYYVCCHLKDCIHNDGLGRCSLLGPEAIDCYTGSCYRYTKILTTVTEEGTTPKREKITTRDGTIEHAPAGNWTE